MKKNVKSRIRKAITKDDFEMAKRYIDFLKNNPKDDFVKSKLTSSFAKYFKETHNIDYRYGIYGSRHVEPDQYEMKKLMLGHDRDWNFIRSAVNGACQVAWKEIMESGV